MINMFVGQQIIDQLQKYQKKECKSLSKYYKCQKCNNRKLKIKVYQIDIIKEVEMPQLYAGTAFGQVFSLPLNTPKNKQKILKHGMMKKQPITSVCLSNYPDKQSFTFASTKNIFVGSYNNLNNNSQTVVFSNKYTNTKIIGIQHFQDSLVSALNDGSLLGIKFDGQYYQTKQILSPKISPDLDRSYNRLIYDQFGSFCLIGKEVMPFLFDFNKNLVTWNGKNVPNDELDLRVPINDVDATFFKNRNCLACAHASNKVRVYDVRTNKQRPSSDFHLKLDKVYNKSYLTKIIVNPNQENTFFVANDLGGVYQCDIRKSMGVTGKFKQINSTVTDMVVFQNKLFTTSLDCYVRQFDLQSKNLVQKYYMNKQLYSLKIFGVEEQEVEQFDEEALSEEEEVPAIQKEQKKVKKLRKRNKVNLKYLKPVNWDQVPIDEQLLKKVQDQYEQINQKDMDHSDNEYQDYKVKNEHNSDEDSDLN